MWNNLATAMGWKFLGIRDPTALIGLMFFVSISVPIVPTIIILAMNLDPNSMEKTEVDKLPTFLEKYFFCVVNEPAWWGYRLWFILFSVPGIVAASILFWKTVKSRRKMIKFSNTSQFSKIQLARMFFALLAYLVLSILSVVLGFMDPKNKDMINVSDFIPACVGFLLFITYGLGNTANEFYKKIYIKLGKKMGIELTTLRTSVSSKSDSLSSSYKRRQSSIMSGDTKARKPSQLSESIDEHFIYDLPSISKEKTEERISVPKQQSAKRKNVRRGSEPSNQRKTNFEKKKRSIEMIPEVNEDFEEESERLGDKWLSPLFMSFEFADSGSENSSFFRTSSALDFVKGFITGQVALLSLLFLIIRFLFFRSVGPVAPSSNSIKLESSSFISKNQKKKNGSGNFPIIVPFETDSALLERLFGLDHQLLKQQANKSGYPEILISDESTRLITFMLSKVIFDPLRAQIQHNPSFLNSTLQDKLEEIHKKKSSNISALKQIDTIQIKSVNIGNFYPSIDSYQLFYDTVTECCAFRIKCSWRDVLALEIESALTLIGLIALPFTISIKLKNIRFTAQLQSSEDGDSFELSVLPDDNLLIDLEVGSLLGHRTKLKDLPKIKNAVIEAVKKILSDTIINPKFIKLPFPKFQDIFILSTLEKYDGILPEELDTVDSHSKIIEESSKLYYTGEKLPEMETSFSLMNDTLIEKSLISDESEPMNVFLDSRYEDDFDDEIEMEKLMKRSIATK